MTETRPRAFDAVAYFRQILVEDESISTPIAAIKALTAYIKASEASTMSEFMQKLKEANAALQASPQRSIAISAGCDLFLHFVNRTAHDVSELEACKQHLVQRGEQFVEHAPRLRERIADVGLPFIRDGATILLHSYSRVVMRILLKAALGVRFRVYVTESRPSASGKRALHELRAAGIPATLILDAAVGHIIEKTDLVLVGAEGVVENGGIINQVGTYQIAVVAKASNKPFYVVTESYKFVRSYPLNQYDLPGGTTHGLLADSDERDSDVVMDTVVDYTPPLYITLLFTDLGVMTPAGVSDALIRSFYEK